MKFAQAVRALDERTTVYDADGDSGWIAAVGKYETSRLADWERNHPMNKRSNAFVHWRSGMSVWTPIRALRLRGE